MIVEIFLGILLAWVVLCHLNVIFNISIYLIGIAALYIWLAT